MNELEELHLCTTACSDDDDCGDGFVCFEDVCVIACDDDDACAAFGDDVTCRLVETPRAGIGGSAGITPPSAPICAKFDEMPFFMASSCTLRSMDEAERCPLPGFCLATSEETLAGMCTLRCETNENCPANGECIPVDRGTWRQCFQPCGPEQACPDDLACRPAGIMSREVCMPGEWADQLDSLSFQTPMM